MTPPVARELPALETLTWDQSAGRACVWCKKLLTTGAVSAGTIPCRDGAHVLDTEVWACPECDAGETPHTSARPAGQADRPQYGGTSTTGGST
ncbi:hypothetical protein [Streptomyces sp. NPDC056844]|uniref:hypothetical protein n=1 Tax=unclassified Streptomyces TaxID=2593676 RepID=UPI0036CEBB29